MCVIGRPPLLLRLPANPALARNRLEGTGLPPRMTHPATLILNKITQAATGKALESQIMVLARQPISLGMFTGPGKTNLDLPCSNR